MKLENKMIKGGGRWFFLLNKAVKYARAPLTQNGEIKVGPARLTTDVPL